jgi:hypothetical protein
MAAAVAAPAGMALAAATPLDSYNGLRSSPAHGRAVGWQPRAFRVLRPRRERPHLPPILRRIAECESHGDPKLVGGGGLYRGKYQFSRSTWASVGGHGDPIDAPEAEQDRRAAMLLKRSGPSQWPVCSR